MTYWPSFSVAELQRDGLLLVEDGNHGEYRPRPDEFVADGTPFIRAADLADGEVLFAQAGTINAVALSRVRKGIGKPGDILFSHKGTVGKLARVPMDAPLFVCSPQTTFWRALDESRLRRDYLYAFMRSRAFVAQWWARKGETDMADYVSLTAQRQLRVTVPPPDVQRKLAEPLRALDDLIDANRLRVNLLNRMTEAVYREWFVHFRYPGRGDVALVDSSVGPIPEGWEVKPLGEISTNFDRLRKPLSKAMRAERSGLFPYYGAAKLIDWIDDWIFDGEYLLFAEDGSVQTHDGYPVLQLVCDRFWANNHTHILQGKGVSTRFLFLAAAHQPIVGYVTGAAQPKITQENLNRIPLVVAPQPILEAFDNAVDPTFDMSRLVLAQNGPLTAIRDLLLPKLVTGEIEMSDLESDTLVERVS